MSFNVRLYGHSGLYRMRVVGSAGQFSSDSVFVLSQPYLWAQLISVSSVAAASAVASLDGGGQDTTEILRIEVPDGSSIRYEVNPPNRPGGAKTANVNSPILSGRDQIRWGANYTISLIDAAGLA